MEVFSTKRNLIIHKKTQHITQETLECTACDKRFSEEWKLNAHMKSHKKYPCDKCEKTFRYESLKEKHIKIKHEQVKLYCHFFNNKKNCPK